MGPHVTPELAADRTLPANGEGRIIPVTTASVAHQLTGAGGLLAGLSAHVWRWHFVADQPPGPPAQCWVRMTSSGGTVDRTATTASDPTTTADLVLETGLPEEWGFPRTEPVGGQWIAVQGLVAGRLILSPSSP